MADQDIARLRGIRNVYLRHNKNSEREIVDLLNNFNIEDEEKFIKLTSLKTNFSKKIQEIKRIDSEILQFLKPEDLDKELDQKLNREEAVV